MKVWIDLANSPHVLFFAPIVADLESTGAEVRLTARTFAQTVDLALLYGLHPEVIGSHGGRSYLGKARAISKRVSLLRRFAKSFQPDVAVSHGSYPMGIVARSLGLRSVTFMDYEHTPANHLSFRTYTEVVLPVAIDQESVRRYGATRRKTTFYNGFKEQVHLESFEPDRTTIDAALGLDEWGERVRVVARPPADFAVYHRNENPLFEQWLLEAGHDERAVVIVLPRTDEQRRRVQNLALPSVVVPERPVNGANLVDSADLVVSAGGTMNREAAVLGVPAYSIFSGAQAGVDRRLNALGRLEFVTDADDLAKIRLERGRRQPQLRNPGLRAEIVDVIRGSGS